MKKSAFLAWLIGSALMLFAQQSLALSPPWYLFRNQVNATLGKDKCVQVDELQEVNDARYVLNIHVCRKAKAKSLAVFMDRTEQFGNIAVDIRILDSHGKEVPSKGLPSDATEIRETLTRALKGNCYFVGTLDGNFTNAFFLEFTKSVVQYYGDNLADAYGNINEVAATAFQSVLKLPEEPPVGTTTSTRLTTACHK